MKKLMQIESMESLLEFGPGYFIFQFAIQNYKY
jgi:hypothetical protein